MSLMHVDELRSLTDVEREHLQQVEEAVQDAILAGQLVAKSSHLDVTRMSRATVTLLMALAARHAIEQFQRDTINEEFVSLAKEIAEWTSNRVQRAPTLWH